MRTDVNREWHRHRKQPVWTSTSSSTPQAAVATIVNVGPVARISPLSRPSTVNILPVTTGCSWSAKAHEYSQNSSLHGLRYIGDTRLHFFERLFWIISFFLAVIGAAYFITNIYQKWTEMPVIMSLSPTATALTSIPFPAVTICNMNNVRKSVAERILQKSNDNPEDEAAKLDVTLLHERCNHEVSNEDEDDNRTGDWNYVKKFMIKGSQPCSDMLVACFWHKDPKNCIDLFNPTLTDEGICCSFNKIKREFIFHNPRELSDLNVSFQYQSVDWNPENGYPPDTPADYIPWRPWGSGSHLGLTVVVDAEQDEYYCSSEASLGFKVLLHNPVETPKMSAFGSVISPGKETRFVINPHIMTSTPQLIDVSVEKRNCYFNSERRLRFYRVYTERNCIVECEANFTLQFCNCVMYYMPKDKLTRICGKKDTECAYKAKQSMEKILAYRILNASLTQNLTEFENCDCLPSCFDLDYSKVQSTSVLTEKVNVSDYLAGRNQNYFRKNMAVFHMFFKEAQFTGVQRGVLFGFTEFLSNTGGLLGLFMGFSFLSAVEAFYFLSLRIWCSVIRGKHQNKTKQNNCQNKAAEYISKAPYPYIE